MKRFGILLVLLLLSACTVSIVPDRVIVTPSERTVRPGEVVELSAEPNYDTNSRILWSLGPGDNRNAEDVLDPAVGATTRYTAPQEDGVYTVYAETVDDNIIIRGSAEITVNSFLGAPEINVTSGKFELVVANLQPGEVRRYQLIVSDAVASSGAALIVELNQNVNLELLNTDLNLYASSSSNTYFARGNRGLSSSRNSISPQGISVMQGCEGACIWRDAEAGRSYLRITNPTSTVVTFSLFAYVQNFNDTGEPGNNSANGAVNLTDFDQGAIETLGDEDYYRVAVAGRVQFTAPAASSAIQSRLRADVTNNDDDSVQTLTPSDAPVRVFPGDTVRVYVEGNDYAGATTVSGYVVEVLPAQ